MISGDELLGEYARYYRTRCVADAVRLWSYILQYDFADYNSFAARAAALRAAATRPSEPPRYLRSNGSSGGARAYPFGPLPWFWIDVVERHVKGRLRRALHVETPLLAGADPARFGRGLLPFPWPLLADAAIAVDPARGGVGQLARAAADRAAAWGPLTLSARPETWLRLAPEPEFAALLHSGAVAAVNSTGTDGFFARAPFAAAGVVVNDNCVNWRRGTNFYRCAAGAAHVLPIFAGAAGLPCSLLGLHPESGPGPDDAVAVLGPAAPCPCGATAAPARFTPHPDHWPGPVRDLALADRLVGRYRLLQLVRRGDRLHVLGTDPCAADRATLAAHAAAHGLAAQFAPGRYHAVGAKLPAFWRDRGTAEFPRLPG